MHSGPALVLLLLLAPHCCSASQPNGLRVSCASQNLAELPPLPPETSELYLQDNGLTGVAPGSFDTLRDLRSLNLTGNPLHCGCAIWYLSVWLQDHPGVASREPTCATPARLAHTPVASLSHTHFSTCGRKGRAAGTLEGLTLLVLVALLLLLLWCLKTAKSFTFTLEVFGRHRGFEAHTLRSLKPKHRRKRLAAQAEPCKPILEYMDDSSLEAPLLNMEILPQILDVLQKKHNVKFKAP